MSVEDGKAFLAESEVSWRQITSPTGYCENWVRNLSSAFSAEVKKQFSIEWSELPGAALRERPFEVDMLRVPPGKRAWPRHYHSVQWEYYIVLSGEGEMLQADGEPPIPMAPGMHILQPPGWIHTMVNTGDEDLVYYVIADNHDDEHCYYPDSNKWAAGNMVFRPHEVDYWDGEDGPGPA